MKLTLVLANLDNLIQIGIHFKLYVNSFVYEFIRL